jgi:signal transduction histidine kinase
MRFPRKGGRIDQDKSTALVAAAIERGINYFDTGYIYAFDTTKGREGILTVHPTAEGTSLWDAKDSKGFHFIREMAEKKEGEIRYMFPKPGQTEESLKVATYLSVPEWNWIVVAGVYSDEFTRSSNTVRNFLTERGIPANAVNAVGYGKHLPVTTPQQCEGQRGAELKACLQPDRRVEVQINGLRQP